MESNTVTIAVGTAIVGIAGVAAALLYSNSSNATPQSSTPIQEIDVGGVDDFRNGEMKDVILNDSTTVLLVKTKYGKFYATSNKCTHYAVPLVKGVLNGDRVVCPAHGACFNVTTGDIEEAPALDALVKYSVRVEKGRVLIALPQTASTNRRTPTMCPCDLSKDNRTFVIVGGGPTGVVAAQTLREDGFTGKIILVSNEEHLPYDRVKLSKNLAITPAEILLRPQEFFDKNGIEVLLGETATRVDATSKTVSLSSGKTLNFDSLLVATGGNARTIPCEGSNLRNIFALRVPSDAAGINVSSNTAKNVVIIGSSFIGMEAAACLKGKKNIGRIVVVGMERVPFERVLGEEIGAAMQRLHESKGVEFRMGAVLKRYIGNDDGAVSAVELNTGEILPCDLVVIGAGIIPATGFLKDTLPLERDGSIIVDAGMRATENIFVAGDIARFPYWGTNEVIRIEHWDVAQQQGRIAAHNMAGKKAEYDSVPMFWTMQYGVPIRYAGNAMSWDRIILKGDVSKYKFMAYYVSKENKITACVGVGCDPVPAAALELFHEKRMPSPEVLLANDDPTHLLTYL